MSALAATAARRAARRARGEPWPEPVRTALLYALPAVLVASGWLRLEEDGPAGAAAVVALLALLPALARSPWARAAAAVLVAPIAVRVAFGLSPLDARPLDPDRDYTGPVLDRLRDGVLAFWDVNVPFPAADHAEMHGAVVLATFGFCLALGLAVAARRPLAAGLVTLAGAAWPITLVADDGRARGALILLAVLVLLAAGGRRRPTGYRQPALAAAALVALALVAAASPAVAKGEFLAWKSWDLYDQPDEPVSVAFVWNANYGGISFPEQETTVLTVEGPARPLYWRATTLDIFDGLRWREELFALGAFEGPVDLPRDGFLPARAFDRSRAERVRVRIEALRDERLPAPSAPIRVEPEEGLRVLSIEQGGVLRAEEPPERGATYTVYAYAPQPTPRQLARARPTAQLRGTLESHYLEVAPGEPALPWGTPGRDAQVRNLIRTRSGPAAPLAAYGRLYELAREVTEGTRSPYAAVNAVETWFLRGGGFRYEEQPGVSRLVPPLVDFVSERRAGYCQQFAGAMTLMLRYLGIPARVAVGFTSGRYNRATRRWTVTDHDAHAWVEVWFRGWGWISFDPTPGRSQLAGSVSAASQGFDAGAFRDVFGRAGLGAGALGATVLGERNKGTRLGLDLERGDTAVARAERTRGDSLARLLGLVLAAALAAVVLAKAVRRRLRYLSADPRRQAAACRAELADFLADQGVHVGPSATPAELAASVERRLGVDAGRFASALAAARFGPPHDAARAAARARAELRLLRRALRRRLSARDRLLGAVSVRSLGLG